MIQSTILFALAYIEYNGSECVFNSRFVAFLN